MTSYKLPSPPTHLELGDVDIGPFPVAQNIAQFVAYAASVSRKTSNLDAIQRIGRALGCFTMTESSVRAVSAPLLGAGAGGLQFDAVIKALKTGFLETASPNATLTICVLDRFVYNSFAQQPHPATSTQRPLRVFISYTATDVSHAAWVEALGAFLRNNGVEARLDKWHLRNGMDLPQWMSNELQLADRVIIISNEQYAAKADGRLGGVGWETMLIQGDIATQQLESHKYLIVVRSADFAAGRPRYLKTKFASHWPPTQSEAAMRDDLLKELLQVSSEPPLGAPTVFLS
ncbi:MAG: toll/interleukin-1 receptor domain-containing protein [Chthoniobacteraceae bacterium]